MIIGFVANSYVVRSSPDTFRVMIAPPIVMVVTLPTIAVIWLVVRLVIGIPATAGWIRLIRTYTPIVERMIH